MHVIPGFDYQRVPVADGVSLHAARRRLGQPDRAAARLPADPPDVAARRRRPGRRPHRDLPRPARLRRQRQARRDRRATYAKRTMAADIVALARALGHDRFALAGHDRGALVAIRAGLDHPEAVTHLASLDVLPTLDMWDVMHGTTAAVGFHLYLMAQPPGLPEQMIAASAGRLLRPLPRHLDHDPEAIPRRRAGRLPGSLPRGGAVDRRRLPRLGRHRRRPRPGRPRRRAPAADAGHRPPAGLGRRAGLRRRRAVAGLGARPAPRYRLPRPLHGRGGTRPRSPPSGRCSATAT